MNYTILIYNSPADFAFMHGPDSKKLREHWAAWPKYVKEAMDAGVFVGGAGLQRTETATTLKFSNDKRQVRDGPYTETKEQLGGFVSINVPDLDAALDWAARCPRLPGQACEIRPNLVPPGSH